MIDQEIYDAVNKQGIGAQFEAFGELARTDPEGYNNLVKTVMKQSGTIRIEVGTAYAMCQQNAKKTDIIFVCNPVHGNGDFQRLMDTIESQRPVTIVKELWNKRLRRHLIEKRGYVPTAKHGHKTVIKRN